MAAGPPPRDSVLDALGFAIRVLGKPGFLWAPILLYLIFAIPLIPLYTMGMTAAPPTTATAAELEAYMRGFIPTIVAFLVVILVITPIAGAVMFRLAQQYVDGEAPQPFAPGIANLAWRFFLQMLVIAVLIVAALLAVAITFAVLQAIAGAGLAILVTAVGGFIAYVYIFLRLSLIYVLLLSGAGPIEAVARSWELTRCHMGRVFRWLFVSGLVVGIAAGVTGAVIGAVFAVFDQLVLGQVLGTVIAAPFGIVGSIVIVLLARLLSNPAQPISPPPTALPDWMNPNSPAGEPPTAPST